MNFMMNKKRKFNLFCNVTFYFTLSEQLNYLLDKKLHEKQIKKRLQQIQDQFQKKRKLKITLFQSKIQQSGKTKSNQIKSKIDRNKKNLEHVDKINKKAHQEYHLIVQKGLEKRKQFYSQDAAKVSKFISKAQTQQDFRKGSKSQHLNQSKLFHSETSKQMDRSQQKVQNQMRMIEQRLQRAKNNQKVYQKQYIERLQQKERHHSQIQEKIKSYSIIEEQKNIKEIYGKNQHFINTEERLKGMTQKHLSDRRKSFQDKIRKLHQNIKLIQSQKVEKFASLENKLIKVYEGSPPYQALKRKSNTHRQKVMLNNLKIQEQKKQKAEQILKKHSEITAKNKIYKEKKDQILQAIKKKSNPELDD